MGIYESALSSPSGSFGSYSRVMVGLLFRVGKKDVRSISSAGEDRIPSPIVLIIVFIIICQDYIAGCFCVLIMVFWSGNMYYTYVVITQKTRGKCLDRSVFQDMRERIMRKKDREKLPNYIIEGT